MDAAGGGALVPSAKRARLDGGDQQLVASESRALASLEAGTVPRTSSLDAPIMKLTGHGDAVCSVKVSPNGAHLASGSVDKGVFLWNVRGDCEVRAAAAAQLDLKLPPSVVRVARRLDAGPAEAWPLRARQAACADASRPRARRTT